MKILCVYYDEEEGFFTTDPEDELQELGQHEVEVAHSYVEALAMITTAEDEFEPFDMILSDCFLPLGPNDEKLEPYGKEFVKDVDGSLIRGVGLFFPRDKLMQGEKEALVTPRDFVVVISQDYYEFQGARNWARMCFVLASKIEEVDSKKKR